MVQHPIADELRGKARALGLDRLTNKHFEQFERATTGMERHLKRLPRDMLPAQEPAQHLSSEFATGITEAVLDRQRSLD
jgi:hypothetical protein